MPVLPLASVVIVHSGSSRFFGATPWRSKLQVEKGVGVKQHFGCCAGLSTISFLSHPMALLLSGSELALSALVLSISKETKRVTQSQTKVCMALFPATRVHQLARPSKLCSTVSTSTSHLNNSHLELATTRCLFSDPNSNR